MNKGAPDFTDDLSGIQHDVASDVGKILEIAKHARNEESRQTPGRQQPKPAASVGEGHAPPAPRSERVRKPTSAKKAEPQEPIVLENVTTRLRRQTNELLTESALRQRLKKASPASRQDIIEAALQDWFRKHSYAPQRIENPATDTPHSETVLETD